MKSLKNISLFIFSLWAAIWIDIFLASAVNGKLYIPNLIGSFATSPSIAWVIPLGIVLGIIACLAFIVVLSILISKISPVTPNGYAFVFFVSSFLIFVPLIVAGQDPIKILLKTEHFILTGLIFGFLIRLQFNQLPRTPIFKNIKFGISIFVYLTVMIFMHYEYDWGKDVYIVNHIRFDEYRGMEMLSIIRPDEKGQSRGVWRTKASADCILQSKVVVTLRGTMADRLRSSSAWRTNPKIISCENA